MANQSQTTNNLTACGIVERPVAVHCTVCRDLYVPARRPIYAVHCACRVRPAPRMRPAVPPCAHPMPTVRAHPPDHWRRHTVRGGRVPSTAHGKSMMQRDICGHVCLSMTCEDGMMLQLSSPHTVNPDHQAMQHAEHMWYIQERKVDPQTGAVRGRPKVC